jgi:glucose-6-phosphate 1-dehydrogenase
VNWESPSPCTFVIFGATGDLTKRLLIPAIYNLAAVGLLPERFSVVGIGRSEMTDADFRDYIDKNLHEFAGGPVVVETARRAFGNAAYVRGDLGDPETYRRLADGLTAIERRPRPEGGHRLFYLATPPSVFSLIVSHLSAAGLSTEKSDGWWRRVIVEKPFGTSLSSARELNRQLLEKLAEHQIYRIDHYLGKETVQNVMVLRFANGLFEPIWNRHHVDHVQITVAEQLTVESRGAYYDVTGALRDMVPNHLLQLLSLIAMEPPADFSADAVRSEKTKVLCSVQPLAGAGRVVRAQYRSGVVDGRRVPDYRHEPKVARNSTTETYVAARLMVDNWRWAGVPFYLRTGKALGGRRTEIAIKFRQAPFALFRETPVERLAENFLVLRIQPDEGASIQFNAKVPGQELEIQGVRMEFRYEDYFKTAPSTGYETLLYDCITGDATLFLRADNIEAGWRVVQPILDAWRDGSSDDLAFYDAGSPGPVEADALLERDGRRWRPIR